MVSQSRPRLSRMVSPCSLNSGARLGAAGSPSYCIGAVTSWNLVPAAVAPGWYKDAMSGERIELGDEGASLELEPFGVRILVPENNSCVDL